MIRLWGKIVKANKLILHDEVTCSEDISYDAQLKKCMTELCYKLDIEKPYWLPKNLEEYNSRKKTTFDKDNFIEEINFDKLEIIVLDEK